MLATPSPYCNQDWDYITHGQYWNCKCEEGHQQSPIMIPAVGNMLNKSAVFTFNDVKAQSLNMMFEDNIIKLKSGFADDSDFSMGSLIDVDYTEYNAKEIHFHTPAEHSLNGK